MNETFALVGLVLLSGKQMNDIMIIRGSTPDGSIFHSIVGALQEMNVRIIYSANPNSSSLMTGDIELFLKQLRVTKTRAEIRLNHREFSILYCMARYAGRVFDREQLYNVAFGGSTFRRFY